MRCPDCHGQCIKGWADRSVEIVLDAHDDIVDEELGDVYFDCTSAALCMRCNWQGTVGDCTHPTEEET
jgi:hypothetical protein